MGGRSPVKRKEDVMAMREIADRRKRRQEQERQDEARRLEQARFPGSPLPTWANDAIRKSQG